MLTFLTLYSFEVFIAETVYNLSLPKLFSKHNVYFFDFGYIWSIYCWDYVQHVITFSFELKNILNYIFSGWTGWLMYGKGNSKSGGTWPPQIYTGNAYAPGHNVYAEESVQVL